MADDADVLRKRVLIKQHVRGKTFIDVGGLWGTKGETITTAVRGGASSVTMADRIPLDNEWWTAFADYAAERDVTEYDKRVVDITAPDAPEQLGTYDFVHCSGIMYHVPDIFGLLDNLRAITREYLMIGSVVLPDTISGPGGTIALGPDQPLLGATLTDAHRETVVDYLRSDNQTAEGLTDGAAFVRGGRAVGGPWWWLFSAEFMSRVIRAYDLDIVAEGRTPVGRGYTVLARVRD